MSKQPVQIKCTRGEYQTGAQTVYDEINRVFQRVFNVPLEKTLTTFPTLNIQVKKSCAEKKKRKTKLFTKDKSLFGGALEEYISYEVNRLNTVCL